MGFAGCGGARRAATLAWPTAVAGAARRDAHPIAEVQQRTHKETSMQQTRTSRPTRVLRVFALAALMIPAFALAQVKIGLVLSLTGPAASLGIPARDTAALLPTDIAGQKVEYIVLDDASDTTQAVKDAKKLIGDEHVDAIIGASTTPGTLAMLDVVAKGQTPTISLASSAAVIQPVDAERRWMFKTPQTDAMMLAAIMEHAASRGVKTIAYIGQADAFGATFYSDVVRSAQQHHMTVIRNERFNRADPVMINQALKIVALHPDAVIVGAGGTAAALPPRALRERGYKGLIYHNHGVANRDFLQVCGTDCNGTFVPVSPVLVASQLPQDWPTRPVALDYVSKYEARDGDGSVSASGAYAWDAGMLLQNAIPVALKKAAPGTVEFRRALRDALESTRDLAVTNGVVTMSRTDHLGLGPHSHVIVKISDGEWLYQPH
jgi:branched-chain amino acid transport system substrate-binding protein